MCLHWFNGVDKDQTGDGEMSMETCLKITHLFPFASYDQILKIWGKAHLFCQILMFLAKFDPIF